MNYKATLAACVLLMSTQVFGRDPKLFKDKSSGTFSLGTRNTLSMFNDDATMGKGIGGQFRIQFSDRFNTEWYADYITATNGMNTFKNDYHIGWSTMFYPGRTVNFSRLFQPYIIAGHCFDYSFVAEQADRSNSADRTSMATQAGVGTHLNITPKFDCSLSLQYMMHFGREIETTIVSDAVLIERSNFSKPDGHLLFTVSFNYKFADMW